MQDDSEHDQSQLRQPRLTQNEENNNYMQDEDHERDRQSSDHGLENKSNHIFNFGNKKRREIKMEREELTNLFSQLITLVNFQVSDLDCATDKIKVQLNSLKNKSRQPKPKQSPNLLTLTRSPEEPTIARKISMKQQRNSSKEQGERERTKRQLFANYQQIMNYKIHPEYEEPIPIEMPHENMSSNCNDSCRDNANKNKQFAVFQSVSLMINPVNNPC